MDKVTLANVVSFQNDTSAVALTNSNNALITTALNNTLSRDGTAPNQMGASLDMNSNQILNLPAPSTANSPARLVDLTLAGLSTGTSGHTIPYLDGNNTFSGINIFQISGGGNPTLKVGSTATWPLSLYSFANTVATVDIVDQQGTGALSLAMRSSDWNTTPLANALITSSVLAVHDRTTTGSYFGIWGNYWQTVKTAGASATETFGLESSFQNLGSSVTVDPFTLNPTGATINHRLDSGTGAATGNPVSVALQIIPNGNTFNSGISIGTGSIANRGGNFYAIEMPDNYGIAWYNAASVLNGYLTVDNTATFQLSGAGGLNINGPIYSTNISAIIVKAIGVNFNSANTDTSIPIVMPAGVTNYRAVNVIIANASASISTATFGLFSASGGGGTALLTAGQAITVTTAAANTANNMQLTNIPTANTESFNFSTLFFRVGTAQGSAATADVFITLNPLY